MNLKDQIAWERECADRGATTYYNTQDRLRDSGKADEGDAISYLLNERLQIVAKLIEQQTLKPKGRGAMYTRTLKQVCRDDYLKAAFIGTQAVFQSLFAESQSTLLKITLRVGTRLEADLKCQLFEAKYPAYYATVEKSMRTQHVTDATHKHKVFMKKFNDFDIEWNDFEPEVRVQVGLRIVDCILYAFNDVLFTDNVFKNGHYTKMIKTTPALDDWIAEFEKTRGFMNPTLLPLKIPPRPWDNVMEGGYYTPQLRAQNPFVKTKGRDHAKFVKEHVPLQHTQAVNKLQRTAWKINKRVLDVQAAMFTAGLRAGLPSSKKITPPPFPDHLQDIPKDQYTQEQQDSVTSWKVRAKDAYARETARKGKVLAYSQSHTLGRELADWPELYFVYNCDFRGRIYCATSGLSPQGADAAKGTLTFAKAIKLGTTGVRWLAVHGANVYGVDKVSYEDRVNWIKEREHFFKEVVDDPVGNHKYWAGADKPYQFLAFIFEWAGCDYGRDITFESSLPVGLDGTCNGLQHYSAILRDPVGAVATNLTYSETPQDIYNEVAIKCTEILQGVSDPRAATWLRVGIERKLTKRPVMTLPYGAKQSSAMTAIFDWLTENWEKFDIADKTLQWDYAKFLTPYLWAAIGEVVVAAREAMTYLQKNVGKGYCHWLTPLGFPVYQFYKEVEPTRIRTKLCGSKELYLRDGDVYGEPRTTRQRNSVAPNFIHSIDSSHLVMVVNATTVGSLAMIHDDFGTHAGATDTLFKDIRTQFCRLYTEHDPLTAWSEQVGGNTYTLPEKGTYDIQDIHSADYFFG